LRRAREGQQGQPECGRGQGFALAKPLGSTLLVDALSDAPAEHEPPKSDQCSTNAAAQKSRHGSAAQSWQKF
jgi:hypothetical protein